jgi:hypothetical protein
MMIRNAVLALVSGLIPAIVPAFAQTAYASSSWLPPAGIASTETIQVNVVNNATAPASAPAPSCAGTIAFYNPSGSIIGTAAPFTIGDGEIFSATLPYASTGASASRAVVQVKITLSGNATSDSSSPRCIMASSLEIFDTASGVTHAFVSGTTQLPVAALRTGIFSPVPR